MKSQAAYIVFFDLDRTILSMNSGYAMGKVAYNHGVLGKSDMLKAFFYTALFKLKLRSAEKMINGMGSWLCGLPVETVETIAGQSVKEYLVNSVYQEFYDELLFHKSRNAHLALLSSAISEICDPLAKELGLDRVVCTTMEQTNGKLTGIPSGNYCYGDEKRIRFAAFCELNGFDQSTSWYYADAFSDLPALEFSGNPVCVNPDSKLRRTALKRGWKIMRWEKISRKI